jgi:hypothetical protein
MSATWRKRKEHSWNEWDYENSRTPVWVMMLTSASCSMFLFCASRLRHQYSRNSTSVRYRHDVMSSTREDVIRRRHVLLRCADSSLNHELSKTASFVSCLDACLDASSKQTQKVSSLSADNTALYPRTELSITTTVRTSNPTLKRKYL